MAVNVNIYHGYNVNYILILCVHYICHLSLCKAINPSSGLWRSVYSDVHKAWFYNFIQTAIPRSSVPTQFADCSAVQCKVYYSTGVLCGWKLPWAGEIHGGFFLTQISVTSVFLHRGPQGHQGGWDSPLFR